MSYSNVSKMLPSVSNFYSIPSSVSTSTSTYTPSPSHPFQTQTTASPEFATATFHKLTPHFCERNSLDCDTVLVSCDDSKYIAIAFGTSESREDWETNSKFLPRKFGPRGVVLDWKIKGDVKIHRGFNDAFFAEYLYLRIEEVLIPLLKKKPGYQVFITGHSLGGAIATIAGVYFAKQMPNTTFTVINFGAPRVGNQHFKTWAESISNLILWRFVLEQDLVSRIPTMGMGYRHAGHLVQLDRKKGSKAYYLQWGDKTKGLIGPEVTDWDVKLVKIINADAIQNHKMSLYIQFLELQVKKNPDKFFVRGFERTPVQKYKQMTRVEYALCCYWLSSA